MKTITLGFVSLAAIILLSNCAQKQTTGAPVSEECTSMADAASKEGCEHKSGTCTKCSEKGHDCKCKHGKAAKCECKACKEGKACACGKDKKKGADKGTAGKNTTASAATTK